MSYKKHCKIWTSGVSYFGAKIVQILFLKNGPNFDGSFLKPAKISNHFFFGDILKSKYLKAMPNSAKRENLNDFMYIHNGFLT